MLLVRFPGNAFAGHWTLGTYLDQRANQEQMQALGTILSGEAGGLFADLGGLIETALPVKQVAINFETVDGEHRITVPGLLEVASERIPSPMPEQPPLDTSINDSAVPFYTRAVNVRRTTVLKLKDPDISFDHSGWRSTMGVPCGVSMSLSRENVRVKCSAKMSAVFSPKVREHPTCASR